MDRLVTGDILQGTELEMLVDHYPLRRIVESRESSGGPWLHWTRLLAEALAGGEVLVLAVGEGVIGLPVDGRTVMAAATRAEYERSGFVQHLAEGFHGQLILHSMDSRQLVQAALALPGLDGILFDFDIHRRPDHDPKAAFEDSFLPVNALARCSVDPLGPDGSGLLPTQLLSMLAREEDPDERRYCLSGFLRGCGGEALQRTMVLQAEEDPSTVYSTFARFAAHKCAEQPVDGDVAVAFSCTAVPLSHVLGELADEGGRISLDGTTSLSSRTASSVLRANGLGL